MSRGYPDWFGQSVWPKWGTPILAERLVTVPDHTLYDMIDVSAQGILVECEIEIENDHASDLHAMYLNIDGQGYAGFTLGAVRDYESPFVSRAGFAVSLASLDIASYRISLQHQVPFKTGFTVQIYNALTGAANTITGYARSVYYVVT